MEIERFLILSALLFAIGLYGTLSRRHIITVLMSLEIMFNAVNLAFVSLSRYITPAAMRMEPSITNTEGLLIGQTFAVFVIVVAAAEVALGLALVILFFRNRDTIDVSEMNLLRR